MIQTCMDILEIYREAINKIDDYFEYRNESERDKTFVMGVIDEITPKIQKLQEGKKDG